jgi:molybdopterin-guanine dinucleotide biosynthesis protein A
MTTFPERFDGYILAGGKSSRMKTDKAFLQIGGETFLTRTLKTLSSICENRIKIVINKAQDDFIRKLPADVPHIFDVFENRGALAGIHAALKNCETKYAIILAVDLPLVTNETIEKLAEITLSSNKFIATVPRQTDGRFQPLCAVYHARYCLSSLEQLMNENDSASVHDFLKTISPRFVDQNRLTTGESNNIFFNVNHPTDFQLLK